MFISKPVIDLFILYLLFTFPDGETQFSSRIILLIPFRCIRCDVIEKSFFAVFVIIVSHPLTLHCQVMLLSCTVASRSTYTFPLQNRSYHNSIRYRSVKLVVLSSVQLKEITLNDCNSVNWTMLANKASHCESKISHRM